MSEVLRAILDPAPELERATEQRIARELERPATARVVAEHLGLSKTDWVYANAGRLGGWRIGDGSKARSRIPPIRG